MRLIDLDRLMVFLELLPLKVHPVTFSCFIGYRINSNGLSLFY